MVAVNDPAFEEGTVKAGGKRPFPTAEERTDEVNRLRDEVERLRTILRSVISAGGLGPIATALAMNALDAGSGDAWLEKRRPT